MPKLNFTWCPLRSYRCVIWEHRGSSSITVAIDVYIALSLEGTGEVTDYWRTTGCWHTSKRPIIYSSTSTPTTMGTGNQVKAIFLFFSSTKFPPLNDTTTCAAFKNSHCTTFALQPKVASLHRQPKSSQIFTDSDTGDKILGSYPFPVCPWPSIRWLRSRSPDA